MPCSGRLGRRGADAALWRVRRRPLSAGGRPVGACERREGPGAGAAWEIGPIELVKGVTLRDRCTPVGANAAARGDDVVCWR